MIRNYWCILTITTLINEATMNTTKIKTTLRLTEAEVHAKCDEMLEMGEKPTSIQLLSRFGRGGMGTITKYMKTWEAKDEIKSAGIETLPAVVPLPDRLSKDGDDLLKKLWNVAKSLSDEEIESERERMRQADVARDAEIKEAIDYSDVQSDMIDNLNNELESIIIEKDDLKTKVFTIEQELKDNLKDKTLLEIELSKAIDQSKSLTNDVSSLNLKAAVNGEQINNLKTTIINQDKEIDELKKAHEKSISKLELNHEKSITTIYSEHKKDLDRLMASHDSATQSIKEAHAKSLESAEQARIDAISQYNDMINSLKQDKINLSETIKSLQSKLEKDVVTVLEDANQEE